MNRHAFTVTLLIMTAATLCLEVGCGSESSGAGRAALASLPETRPSEAPGDGLTGRFTPPAPAQPLIERIQQGIDAKDRVMKRHGKPLIGYLELYDADSTMFQDLLKTTRTYLDGDIAAKAFTSYLEDGDFTPGAAARHWLYKLGMAGDPWATFFYVFAWTRQQSGHLMLEPFEGMLTPDDRRPYFFLANRVLIDQDVMLLHSHGRDLINAHADDPAYAEHPRVLAAHGFWHVGYKIGHGRNVDRAYDWFCRAAEAGDPFGKGGTLLAASSSTKVSDEQLAQALTWTREASEAGLAWATYLVGIAQVKGIGTEQAPEAGYAKLEEASRLEVPYASRWLGICHQMGWGVKKDLEQATTHYRYASSIYGDSASHIRLGYLLFNQDTPRNHKELAFQHWRQAAYALNPEGMRLAAWCMGHGEGVKKDQAKAIKLLNQRSLLIANRRDAKQWADDYLDAEYVTISDVMSKLKRVAGDVDISSDTLDN